VPILLDRIFMKPLRLCRARIEYHALKSSSKLTVKFQSSIVIRKVKFIIMHEL